MAVYRQSSDPPLVSLTPPSNLHRPSLHGHDQQGRRVIRMVVAVTTMVPNTLITGPRHLTHPIVHRGTTGAGGVASKCSNCL